MGGDNVQAGAPTVAGASIAAEVIEQGRGPKIIAFKKRRRKNSRRKRGHRQEFTLVRITEILTEGRKPSEEHAASRSAPRSRRRQTPAKAAERRASAEKPKRATAAKKPSPTAVQSGQSKSRHLRAKRSKK